MQENPLPRKYVGQNPEAKYDNPLLSAAAIRKIVLFSCNVFASYYLTIHLSV